MAVIDFEKRHHCIAVLVNVICMGVTFRISLQTHWHRKVGYYFQNIISTVLLVLITLTPKHVLCFGVKVILYIFYNNAYNNCIASCFGTIIVTTC